MAGGGDIDAKIMGKVWQEAHGDELKYAKAEGTECQRNQTFDHDLHHAQRSKGQPLIRGKKQAYGPVRISAVCGSDCPILELKRGRQQVGAIVIKAHIQAR